MLTTLRGYLKYGQNLFCKLLLNGISHIDMLLRYGKKVATDVIFGVTLQAIRLTNDFRVMPG